MVTDGAPADLKDFNNANSFHPRRIGEWSWYNGRLMRYDDYGNMNYGALGTAFGSSEGTLKTGSNINQFFKNLNPWNKLTGFADEDRDSEMIQIGINYYFSHIKK